MRNRDPSGMVTIMLITLLLFVAAWSGAWFALGAWLW
jgi:hypothetical protein